MEDSSESAALLLYFSCSEVKLQIRANFHANGNVVAIVEILLLPTSQLSRILKQSTLKNSLG